MTETRSTTSESQRPVEQPSTPTSNASRDRSPDEIAREIETIRASLSSTFDELRGRMSPGQVTDQALDYFRSSGGSEFARNLGRSVRDNPLPVLLIGAGIGWLMTTSNGRARGHAGELPPPDARLESGEAHAGMSDAAAQAQGRASEMGDRARETAGSVSQSVSHAASSAGERASGVAKAARHRLRGARESASSAGERSGELSHETRERMQHFGMQARQRWSRMAEEQPLVLGAIGVALGAALAAGLPATRFENRLMGSASDTMKDRAARAAGKQYEHAKEVASETYEGVTEDMEKRGLSSENVAETAASAVERAGTAADKMAEDVKTGVESDDVSREGESPEAERKERQGSAATSPTPPYPAATGPASPTATEPAAKGSESGRRENSSENKGKSDSTSSTKPESSAKPENKKT